jgi:hypothetical protein
MRVIGGRQTECAFYTIRHRGEQIRISTLHTRMQLDILHKLIELPVIKFIKSRAEAELQRCEV